MFAPPAASTPFNFVSVGPIFGSKQPTKVQSGNDTAAEKCNCLHLTGVEGALGDRINGVYARHVEDATKSPSYTHTSSSGVRAVRDKSAFLWRIFDGDVCVAHWADSLPPSSPESLHRYGMFHAENHRYAAALSAFQAAAAAGHVPSYTIVFVYLSESRPGVALDSRAAFAAAQSGAEGGSMDCKAALALCHLKGIGTEPNMAKATELCSQSIVSFSPMACYVQGLLHLENGAPSVLKKRAAIPFLQIAASAEINASAAFNLAVLLSDPGDEFCDVPQAIRLFKFASALGMQSAQDHLSRLDHQSQIQPSTELPCSAAVEQSASSCGEHLASSDVLSVLESLDSNNCRAFCSSISVRALHAAGVQEIQGNKPPRENFELSPNAKACLAPSMLVLTKDGLQSQAVELHFPKYDSAGAYIPTFPTVRADRSVHVFVDYAGGSEECPRCHMYGPSSQTGRRKCTICRNCDTCCSRNPTCKSAVGSSSSSSLFPTLPIGGVNIISVPDLLKEQRGTSGAYFASQSLWRNGFPVYFQATMPNEKEQFIIEFFMRPCMTASDVARSVGIWELKSKDKIGSSECMHNFDTGCDNASLTLPPVPPPLLTGATSEPARRVAQIELACISVTLPDASLYLLSENIASYVSFCVAEEERNSLQYKNGPHQIASASASKSHRGGRKPKDIINQSLTCVWLNSKTGHQSLSSIGVNVCPPMNVCVDSCKGQYAIFVNGNYSFQHALSFQGDLVLVYQNVSFGVILGCLVQNNHVSCAISASAIKFHLHSKDLSKLHPFTFPREWFSLQKKSSPRPVPGVETPRDETPRAGFGFGGFGGGGMILAPRQQQPLVGGGGFAFGAPAQPPPFGVPAVPGHIFGIPSAGAASASTTDIPPEISTSAQKEEDLIDCSEMIIRAVESHLQDRELSVHIWPSLSVLADVLKKSLSPNKKPILSHIWHHLLQRCGSTAAALSDFDIIFHLSSESASILADVDDFSMYLSSTLDASISDYLGVISGISSRDYSSSISLSIPISVATFLSTHYRSFLNKYLRKMYHAIIGVLASNSVDGLTRASTDQMNTELCIEVASVIGAPFGLDAEQTLLTVNPFTMSSNTEPSRFEACQFDSSFCNSTNQSGFRHELFHFAGGTVRFPSGPIHCPTSEKFGDGHTKKGYLNFNYTLHSNDAWSVGLIPVSSLRNSSYLWNTHSTLAPVIGYSYGGSGARTRPFPVSSLQNLGVMNVCVGVDADAGICSFYSNGRLISSETVPSTMFPCVIAICGHSGSTFSLSTSNVPDEFCSELVGIPACSSVSLDSQHHVPMLGSALSALFMALLNGSVDRRQKIILDCAFRSLLGAHDHKMLDTAFRDAKGTKTVFKISQPADVARALDRASSKCLECLRGLDPDFSAFTVACLLSFVSKVEQNEFQRKISADSKLMYTIFLCVAHSMLKIKLDATECISFISDLDASIPLPSDYMDALARALLPFFQSDDGTVAARILVESNSESLSCSAHVETFFSALMLQLSSSPHHIVGSVSMSNVDFGVQNSCAFVDMYGSCLACLEFKSCRSSQPNYHHHHASYGYNVTVEVRVGREKPSTHVIFSDIGQPPQSLSVSLIIDKQGIFVFVDSVPICVINASVDALSCSRVLCSDTVAFKVQYDKPSPSSAPFPKWLTLFLKAKLHQLPLDSSLSGSSLSTTLAQRLSLVVDQVLPANQNVVWSSKLQHAMLAELVDLNDESASNNVVCSATDSFIEECRPFMSPSASYVIGDREQTPRPLTETQGPSVDVHAAKNSPTSSPHLIENAAKSSPLTKSFLRFIDSISIVTSNDRHKKSFCSSSTPAEFQFRPTAGSLLTADQQASNIVQIVHKKPSSGNSGAGGGYILPHMIGDLNVTDKVRKISSLPISSASFSAIVRVKDVDSSVVACVELSLSKPGSKIPNRSISFQLYASGLLLRDGNCVGYLPQFAQKQPVTISVLQMGIVSFVVDKKVILEFNIELPSGTVGQLSVCCCGGGVSRIGSPILDTKELFVIEFYQSPLSSSNFPFTIIQSAMQKHFTSLQDRLRFASFAYSLSQILSSSVLKLSGHGLSLIQRSADKMVFDLLCADGLASISRVSDEMCLIHAARILSDWLPEQPDLHEDPSLSLFKCIQPGSSAALVFASVISSQIQSKPVLPTWCLGAISCVLFESFVSSELSITDRNFHSALRSHILLHFDDWNLHLPPSEARAICNLGQDLKSVPAGCGPSCSLSHSGQGNCLLCGMDWGRHGGHTCPNGLRGSWLTSSTSLPSIVSSTKMDSLPNEHACTCSIKRVSETGLDEFLFNSGRGNHDKQLSGKPAPLETEENREFREFLEWRRFRELSASSDSNVSGVAVSVKHPTEQKPCPICFDKGSAVFGCTASFGIFPGSTVSLKKMQTPSFMQSTIACTLQPGQTGFVVCTYQSLALVQGPTTSGIIPCEMLNLVSCVVSSLFYEVPAVRSMCDSVFFADVMFSVAKLGTTYFPPVLHNCFTTSVLSLSEALFSAFGPEYCSPFEFPFQEYSDLLFLSRSFHLLTSSFKHVLQSRFKSVDDLTKMLHFLNSFGSVNWEEAIPSLSFLSFSSGIFEFFRQSQDHFFTLLFSSKKDSIVPNEFVIYKFISSLSSSDVSYLAHIIKHSSVSHNFFIPFSQYFASSLASGNIFKDTNRMVISFLQQSIPPGAFLQMRHALLQLSVCMPVQSVETKLPGGLKSRIQVTKIHRWIVDLLVPHLGATCATIVDGEIQSILPHCGWCDISLPGHSVFRLAVPEGLVLDTIFSAKTPILFSDICANLPLQECFVVEALRSLQSKKLITTTGSSSQEFTMSSHSHLLDSQTNTFTVQPTFYSIGDKYCEVIHAIFARLKPSSCISEHELFRELCGDTLEVKRAFSCSLVSFVLSKMLASGKIVRNGHFLLLAGKSLQSKHFIEPREFRPSTASCIRSMVVVVCDEASSTPQLSPISARTCESFVYDNVVSLVGESFTRIHQDTGCDLSEISECFEKCKGDMVKTIHTLMFDPKFSAKLSAHYSSFETPGAGCIRYVEEGLCPTCLCDKILVALPCEHRYCQECLQDYIRDSMLNSSTPKAAGGADRAGGRLVTNICCPSHVEGCSYMIATTDVKFLATSDYSSFINLICRQTTRAMASGSFPTVTCTCGRIIVGETTESEYECSCGQISTIGDVKNSVAVQNWIAHPFSSCLQEERWKEYTQVGSEARLLLMRTKKCPSCGTKTTKCGCQGVVVCNQMDRCPNEACDHMHCGVCSSHWCWVCGRLGSTEPRCSYPKHLISQAKELFKEAETQVKQMENEFFKNSWRVVEFDDSCSTATVLSVMPTALPFMTLTKGDRVISINGQLVESAENARKALSCVWAPGHFVRLEYLRDGKSKLLVCQAPTDLVSEQDSFVLRRSRIVQGVCEISGAATPDSDLAKCRTLLDKVISSIFVETAAAPVTPVSSYQPHYQNQPGFGFGQQLGLESVKFQPCQRGKRDVITKAVLDPRVKHFLQIAGSTSDELIPEIITDLVNVQKSLLKCESDGLSAHFAPAHAARFFSHRLSPSSAVETKGDALIIKRVAKGMTLRVRKHRSLVSDQVGLLQSGAVFAFREIDGEWAKLYPGHYLDLQSSPSCGTSYFAPHDPGTEGYCIMSTSDFPVTLEEPSETERAAVLQKIAMPDFSAAKNPASTSNTIETYVWKSWAFSASRSPKGYFNRVTFWCHNDTIKQNTPPPVEIKSVFGTFQASKTPSQATTDVALEKSIVCRAVERCDTFGGSISIFDQCREAWLFNCPDLLTPIDPSSATVGRSFQSHPWQLNLKPTFCDSLANFCTTLLEVSSHVLEAPSSASKKVSVMHSVELDAFLHRCGTVCVVMYGNGDWATCHSSHIPSSFKDANPAPIKFDAPLSFGSNSFTTTLPHVGSWDGCGGNVLGRSACAGDGNCSPLCLNCGARSHWTCCGSSDKSSTTCCGPIMPSQAKENDRLFRLVVRDVPVSCCDIKGLSGGAFSIGRIMAMPGLSNSAAAGGSSSGPALGSTPAPLANPFADTPLRF